MKSRDANEGWCKTRPAPNQLTDVFERRAKCLLLDRTPDLIGMPTPLKLKTLDLFSGVGGITLALKGLAEPVAYCDIAPEARSSLESLFTRKKLPRASISPDVTQLDRAWLINTAKTDPSKVDMIVGGFPCVGFSMLGLRQGFKQEESSLFSEILRIADVTQCPMLFLENVTAILTMGMPAIIEELSVKRGYELRWCTMWASNMGAPHQRSRWYCLAVRPGFEVTWSARSVYTPYPWSDMKAEPGVVPPPSKPLNEFSRADRLRIALMGNSVVPDAVRYTFLFLASRMTVVPDNLSTPRNFRLVPAARPAAGRRGGSLTPAARRLLADKDWPKCGLVIAGSTDVMKHQVLPPFRKAKPLDIVLIPNAYRPNVPINPLSSTGLLKKPIRRHAWSTPRHGITHACNYLTTRCATDLPSQIRFERDTPTHLRGGMNPQFAEYMMGFPINWTIGAGNPPRD